MSKFYVRAERAVFVTFKHSPQSAENLDEWYRRLTLINGGDKLRFRGFRAAKEIREKYYNLESEQLDKLARDYEIDYYIGGTISPSQNKAIYRTEQLALYKTHPG